MSTGLMFIIALGGVVLFWQIGKYVYKEKEKIKKEYNDSINAMSIDQLKAESERLESLIKGSSSMDDEYSNLEGGSSCVSICQSMKAKVDKRLQFLQEQAKSEVKLAT